MKKILKNASRIAISIVIAYIMLMFSFLALILFKDIFFTYFKRYNGNGEIKVEQKIAFWLFTLLVFVLNFLVVVLYYQLWHYILE